MMEAPIKRGEMSDETTIAVAATPIRCRCAQQVRSSLITQSRYPSSLIAVS
jgi:hypothetical protein